MRATERLQNVEKIFPISILKMLLKELQVRDVFTQQLRTQRGTGGQRVVCMCHFRPVCTSHSSEAVSLASEQLASAEFFFFLLPSALPLNVFQMYY